MLISLEWNQYIWWCILRKEYFVYCVCLLLISFSALFLSSSSQIHWLISFKIYFVIFFIFLLMSTSWAGLMIEDMRGFSMRGFPPPAEEVFQFFREACFDEILMRMSYSWETSYSESQSKQHSLNSNSVQWWKTFTFSTLYLHVHAFSVLLLRGRPVLVND